MIHFEREVSHYLTFGIAPPGSHNRCRKRGVGLVSISPADFCRWTEPKLWNRDWRQVSRLTYGVGTRSRPTIELDHRHCFIVIGLCFICVPCPERYKQVNFSRISRNKILITFELR